MKMKTATKSIKVPTSVAEVLQQVSPWDGETQWSIGQLCRYNAAHTKPNERQLRRSLIGVAKKYGHLYFY